jgi:hypothetical protein
MTHDNICGFKLLLIAVNSGHKAKDCIMMTIAALESDIHFTSTRYNSTHCTRVKPTSSSIKLNVRKRNLGVTPTRRTCRAESVYSTLLLTEDKRGIRLNQPNAPFVTRSKTAPKDED